MEWGIKENRIAVNALFKYNKTPLEIFNLLKLLKIMKKFVYRTIKRFKEFNTIDDKPRSGHPHEIRTNSNKSEEVTSSVCKKWSQILFTDEKFFTIEEKFNRQNDRVYAHNSQEAAEKFKE
ncbi:hypothetical protein QTP88_020745 [Uroleucon formosanum]